MIIKKYVASLDQSTTTTKFSIFLYDGTLVDQCIVEHKQICQNQGWLQHDPNQINQSVNKSISTVIQRMSKKQGFQVEQILGLGICNQRQTVVCWDSQTLKPLYNAIVWCDSRTKDICQKFGKKYNNFRNKTGLPVSTYFTLFKILWLIQNVQGLKQKIKEGKARFGTIDTWVTLMLTGKYVTDASNASRTHLMDINTGHWDKQLLQIAQISQNCLPKIVNSFQLVGQITHGPLKGVPISCILGDQQSSAYAHNLSAKQMKITYGTGCFMLNNIGPKPIYNESFVTTILSQQNNQRSYGFQVSVQCGGGTINWARRAGFLAKFDELNNLTEFSENLFFMPSFGSIFSPFWKTNVQGGIIGLNFNKSKQDILRALLQSITYRLYDNIKNQKFENITKIIVDGGMTINQQFMQMQADMFNKEIEVRTLDTCWGVAKGVLTQSKILQAQSKFECKNYKPTERHKIYLQKYQKWCEARNRFYGW